MAIVEHSVVIQASQQHIWDVSRDYRVRNYWDCFSHDTRLEHAETPITAGSRVHVQARNGLRMTVEYVQFQAPHVAAISMLDGPRFLEKFAGSWRIQQQDKNTSLVLFRYLIKTRAWTIPFISERVISAYFGHVIKQRLAGLKRYCEQPNSITDHANH